MPTQVCLIGETRNSVEYFVLDRPFRSTSVFLLLQFTVGILVLTAEHGLGRALDAVTCYLQVANLYWFSRQMSATKNHSWLDNLLVRKKKNKTENLQFYCNQFSHMKSVTLDPNSCEAPFPVPRHHPQGSQWTCKMLSVMQVQCTSSGNYLWFIEARQMGMHCSLFPLSKSWKPTGWLPNLLLELLLISLFKRGVCVVLCDPCCRIIACCCVSITNPTAGMELRTSCKGTATLCSRSLRSRSAFQQQSQWNKKLFLILLGEHNDLTHQLTMTVYKLPFCT